MVQEAGAGRWGEDISIAEESDGQAVVWTK